MNNINKTLWIAWQDHRRTDSITRYLNILLVVIKSRQGRLIRYIESCYRTLVEIIRYKPNILFVQNPSIILTFLALSIRPIFRYKLFVDAHNEAIKPYINDNVFVNFVARLLIQYADRTIVTNRGLADYVTKLGGNAFVLPDKAPDVPEVKCHKLSNNFNIVLICTYADDEPYEEIFSAIAGRNDISLYVTGKYEQVFDKIKNLLTDNIHLLGFLEEQDYWNLLASSDAIMDLTEMDDCLVCGAYEGMALKVPLVLSNNKATREYFSSGCIYVENRQDAISLGLDKIIGQHDDFQKQISALHDLRETEWIVMARKLLES